MKKILIIFFSISFISFLLISTYKNDVFSKMNKQDLFISQNECFFNLTDSIIEINKAPFTILYKSQKSQNKSKYENPNTRLEASVGHPLDVGGTETSRPRGISSR